MVNNTHTDQHRLLYI